MIDINKFKSFFNRDFAFLPDDKTEDDADALDYILDSDIAKAIAEMRGMLPIHLFECNVLELAEFYLTAHCLVNDIRLSNSGLASACEFPLQSKSVGSVSVSYAIPQSYLQNERYSFYVTSGYGLKYLALIIPRLKGNVQVASGWTQP